MPDGRLVALRVSTDGGNGAHGLVDAVCRGEPHAAAAAIAAAAAHHHGVARLPRELLATRVRESLAALAAGAGAGAAGARRLAGFAVRAVCALPEPLRLGLAMPLLIEPVVQV
jgi:hypothetical protein